MTTRREFVTAIPAIGTAFAVGGHLVLDDSPARAQAAAAEMDPDSGTGVGSDVGGV